MATAWQLTTADFDAPNVGTVWDLCLSVEYDREALVRDIAAWIGSPDGQEVLDCACGSGFPALDLHRLGYSVTCTDGSPMMLERFRVVAAAADVPLTATEALWEEVGGLYPEQFDAVICRGCSLLYAGTFDDDVDPDRGAVERSLASFAASLRPGGRVYVDVPHERDLVADSGWMEHPSRTIDGHQVELRERLTADPETRLRRWSVEMSIDDASLQLERSSHYMPHADMIAMLEQAGFEDVAVTELPSERYAVITGCKPGVPVGEAVGAREAGDAGKAV
jgi:SAM-dependent methyltransferase